MALMNNYNFPFSTIVSVTVALLFLVFINKFGTNVLTRISIFILGGAFVYAFSGSGYMSFYSITALFVGARLKSRVKLVYWAIVIGFAVGFPWLVTKYLFPVSLNHQYFYFFSTKAWFMKYYPNSIFAIYMLAIPIMLLMANLISFIEKKINTNKKKSKWHFLTTLTSLLIVLGLAIFSHRTTYNSEGKKIIKADYFSYKGDIENTEKNATGTKEYNFAANVNYNLVLIKNNQLSNMFFSFMQIKGFESLHPDIDFATALSFVSCEYYYELGFMSEARHWAYEALVFYPYSIRAMQNLVKTHLVLGEYNAAERMLNTLDKGLLDQKFVREYMPYVSDTNLVAGNAELMQKRSFIPKGKELHRSIEGRLIELLDANEKNTVAYDCLMLYYMMDAQFEKFVELYKNVDLHFEKTPAIYEEALLMYYHRTEQALPNDIAISNETQTRFKGFMNGLEEYKGRTRMARSKLYPEYGKSYLYFLKFVYPNVLETEVLSDEDDYPEI